MKTRAERKEEGNRELALGLKVYGGVECKQDKSAALGHFLKALKLGEKKAAYWAAVCETALGQERRAERRLARAARYDGDAARTLALKLSGAGRDRRAFAFLKKGIRLGDIGCKYYAAVALKRGRGTKKDEEKAFELFSLAAGGGDLAALTEKARAQMSGTGTEKNVEKAEKNLLDAEKRGSLAAHALLGKLYVENCLQGERQSAEADALKRYIEAAEAGDGDGAFLLALAYRNGAGVKKNAKKAAAFALAASKSGNAEAMELVGRLYENGEGVAVDLSCALAAFTAAKRNGRDCGADVARVKKKIAG